MGQHLALEHRYPMPPPTGPARPAAGCDSIDQVGSDRCDSGLKAGKIPLRPALDHATTSRTPVPPHGQSGGVTLKISVGKTVPPQMALLAARAYRRFLP